MAPFASRSRSASRSAFAAQLRVERHRFDEGLGRLGGHFRPCPGHARLYMAIARAGSGTERQVARAPRVRVQVSASSALP